MILQIAKFGKLLNVFFSLIVLLVPKGLLKLKNKKKNLAIDIQEMSFQIQSTSYAINTG